MAKNLKHPIEDPPSASSSYCEKEMETISSEEEEEEEEEGEDHHTIFSTEEDEPEDPPRRCSVKKVYGPGEAQPSARAVASGTKRLSEGTSTNVILKRAKKMSTEGDEKMEGADTKQPFRRRLFSDKDEILLLQGIIDFKAKEKNPFEDKRGLYEFMKDSLSFHATWFQFKDKTRNMQKKYERQEKSGGQASILNPHQEKCFELSKAVWGAVESAISSNGAPKESERRVTKKLDLISSRNGKNVSKRGDMEESPLVVTESDWDENSFFLGMDFLKEKWTKMPVETKKKTQEKMKKLQAEELECKKFEETLKAMKDQCAHKKVELVNEVTSLIMASN